MKKKILRTFSFYQACSDADQLAIVESASLVHFLPGALFYSEGQRTDHFGLVGQGNIRVFKSASNGRELTLYHVRDGEPCLINLLCVVLNRPAMASALVEDPTAVVAVPADVFRNLLTRSDAVRRFVFESTAARMVDILSLVEEITVRRMDARLASLLLRRVAMQRPNTAILSTHDDFAAELGTAREVVSRVLKEMERKGAVRLARGRVLVISQRILETLAEGIP